MAKIKSKIYTGSLKFTNDIILTFSFDTDTKYVSVLIHLVNKIYKIAGKAKEVK